MQAWFFFSHHKHRSTCGCQPLLIHRLSGYVHECSLKILQINSLSSHLLLTFLLHLLQHFFWTLRHFTKSSPWRSEWQSWNCLTEQNRHRFRRFSQSLLRLEASISPLLKNLQSLFLPEILREKWVSYQALLCSVCKDGVEMWKN